MIIKEKLNGFIRHYSDSNLMIRKVGTDEIYSEAVDLPHRNFEYVETNQSIEIMDKDDIAKMLDYALQKVDELEQVIDTIVGGATI